MELKQELAIAKLMSKDVDVTFVRTGSGTSMKLIQKAAKCAPVTFWARLTTLDAILIRVNALARDW